MEDKIVLTREGQKVLDEYQKKLDEYQGLVDEHEEVTEELDKLSEELEEIFDFLGSNKFFTFIVVAAVLIFIFNVIRYYVS